jgi:hypothetical protein
MIEVVEKIDFSLPDIANSTFLTGWMLSEMRCEESVANKQVESVTIQLSDA